MAITSVSAWKSPYLHTPESGARKLDIHTGHNPLTLGRGASPLTLGRGASPLTLGRGASPLTLGRGASPLTLGRGASRLTLGPALDNPLLPAIARAAGAAPQQPGARAPGDASAARDCLIKVVQELCRL